MVSILDTTDTSFQAPWLIGLSKNSVTYFLRYRLSLENYSEVNYNLLFYWSNFFWLKIRSILEALIFVWPRVWLEIVLLAGQSISLLSPLFNQSVKGQFAKRGGNHKTRKTVCLPLVQAMSFFSWGGGVYLQSCKQCKTFLNHFYDKLQRKCAKLTKWMDGK